MNDYLRIMKNHADNLEQAENPATSRALVSQILLGLDEGYNPIISTL